MSDLKIAVLGAGGGGRASAFDLVERGARVNLWEDVGFLDNLRDLSDGALRLAADPTRQAPLHLITTSLGDAIQHVDLIVVCVQRPMLRRLAEDLAHLMTEEQALVLNPGSLGGALEVAATFRTHDRPPPLVGETSTLTHCADPVPGGVSITLEVRQVRFAALPASNTDRLLGMLRPYYPHLIPAQSVLETGLCNGNPVLHPAIALLNAARIERNDGSFRFYADGMTPAVARLIERVDCERQRIACAFGLELVPEPALSKLQGYAESDDYLTAYRDSPVLAPLPAPTTLDHRYLHEDAGEGLVTWLALAEVVGVELPTVEALVRLAEVITGRDYLSDRPRRLESLGLAGMSLQEILDYLH